MGGSKGKKNNGDEENETLIFAPACFENHWVCYVVVPHERKMYVLDSLAHDRNDLWLKLDNAMRIRFQELCDFIDRSKVVDNSLSIVYEKMPKQHNYHDCGMYVLKYLELWDGEGTMPNYSQEDVLRFRQEFVLKWVLRKVKVPQDLRMETRE